MLVLCLASLLSIIIMTN